MKNFNCLIVSRLGSFLRRLARNLFLNLYHHNQVFHQQHHHNHINIMSYIIITAFVVVSLAFFAAQELRLPQED